MSKKKSISEQVYEYLKHMILSMQLKPGERVSEEKIAKHFGCSRAPIRDALKRLAHEGIMNLYPNRYAEIATVNTELVEQIGVVRVFHDIMAVKVAIMFGSNVEFNHMREIAQQCFEAGIEGDTALRIKKDCEFHTELSIITKNKQIIKQAKELFIRIEFIQAARYGFLVSPQEQFDEHCKLVGLLIERKEKEAIELLVRHNARYHAISNTYPDSFFMQC